MFRARLMALLGALAAALTPGAAGAAGRATLVRDIDAVPRAWGSLPGHFVPLDSRTLFLATTPQHGEEPWVTDGTPAGTHLLRDLEPGPDDLDTGGFTCAAPFGRGALLLSPAPAADGGSELALWATDGTTAGTVQLTRIAGQSPCAMAPLDDRIVLTVARRDADQSWVLELWVSDATSSGTRRLAAFRTAYLHATALQRAGDRVFFTPRTEAGVELWRTDGSAAGTRVVSGSPTLDHAPEFLGSLGGVVFFPAGDASGTVSVWRSDGTAAGTFALVEAPPYGYRDAVSDGRHLFVGSADHVLVTDGRRAGTATRASGLSVTALAIVGDSVFILDVASGLRVWRWDDLRGEPALVADIPGTYGGRSAVIPGALLFVVWAPDGARQLWRSDGTPAGTGVVVASSLPYAFDALAANGPRAFFPADGPHGEYELWSSDGTPAGTALLANVGPDDVSTASSDPRLVGSVGERVVFTAISADSQVRELWRSDGSGDGTEPLPALAGGVEVGGAAAFDGALFLGAAPGVPRDGGGLWRTDGTAAGTRLAVPLASAPARHLAVAGDGLYFVAGDATDAVCRTRGSPADTTCGPAFEDVGDLRTFGDRVIFGAGTRRDQEPWISDGTMDGTRMIRDLNATHGSAPTQFTSLGVDVFFVAAPDAAGAALWRTDGTAVGTAIVQRIAGRIQHLTAAGDRLFFVAGEPFARGALWTSDGTAAGTQPLPGISPPMHVGAAETRPLPRLGPSVLLEASDDAHGSELWISDGTPAGTHLVGDLAPGPRGSGPSGFLELGDRVAFVACTDAGCEPWTSDGTAAGTYQLADVAPGVASSDPNDLVAAAGVLYLSATDRVRGRELWRIALDAPCAGDCGGDGTVSIADAITAVAIALGGRPVGDCAAADGDADGSVTISELVAAVRAALDGCR